MNEIAEIRMLLTYLRARTTLARHDESGASAVEWAIIVSLAVFIAGVVGAILLKKARDTANHTPSR